MLGGTRLEGCARQGNKWSWEVEGHLVVDQILLLADSVLRGAAAGVWRFASIKRT